jgi:choice-of-anchor B domain-containing protein
MRLSVTNSLAALLLGLAPAAGLALDEPYNITLLGRFSERPHGSDVWGYTAPDGTELAIYGHLEGTSFVDATDPSAPVEVLHVPGPTTIARDMKTYSHYAYIVCEGRGGGLQIVDLADPRAPVHVATYSDGGFDTAHNLWIDTGAAVAYACGASPTGGTHILSLGDPVRPIALTYSARTYHDLYVREGLFFGAKIEGALELLDASDPANLAPIATHYYPGRTHNVWPLGWPPVYCVTTDETATGSLKVWRLTNPHSVALMSEYRVPRATIHNAFVKDGLAYVSYYTAGTRVVDLVDPTRPLEVGSYDTSNAPGGFDGNWGVYPFRSDGVIYSSDTREGLFILQFTGNYAGQVTGSVRSAGTDEPIEGATIRVNERLELVSDHRGNFGGRTVAAEYAVVTTAFGHVPDTTRVAIPPSGSVVHRVALRPLAAGDVELVLRDAHGHAPVSGVTVEVLAGVFPDGTSDSSGRALLQGLPAGVRTPVRCSRFGFVTAEIEVTPGEVGTVVPVAVARGLTEDFEVDRGWTVGAPDDDATGGIWQRADPVGSYLLGIVGPDTDASPDGGGFAFVTESHRGFSFHASTSDVDRGKTTFFSPVFDLSGLEEVVFSYDRWLSNRRPEPDDDDGLRVDVSADGGETWTNVETISTGTDAWAHAEVDLSALIEMTSAMRLRFAAEDSPPETLLEAGVDNVEIHAAPRRAPVSGPEPDDRPSAGVEIAAGAVAAVRLAPPHPNPFRNAVSVEFAVASSGPARLTVHDVTGRRVASLLDAGRLARGRHVVTWDGRDASGRTAVPGVYFVRLETAGGSWERKIVRVR